MNKPSVLITGAAKGLGRELAIAFAKKGFELELTDINADLLNDTAQITGAARWYAGNLFDFDSEAHGNAVHSKAHVIVNSAAVNVDESQPVRDRLPLRQAQTGTLAHFTQVLRGNDLQQKRLLIPICSIIALARKNPALMELLLRQAGPNQEYGPMKEDMLDLMQSVRPGLEEQNVQVVIPCPGSLNTGFTNARRAMKLLNMFAAQMETGGEEFHQDALIEPPELASVLANLSSDWVTTGNIPDKAKEWKIRGSQDLQLAQ